MRDLKIKICGMRDRGNISDVAALHPDFLGFIFYPPSSRFCGSIDPEVVRIIPEGITPVAVVVNPTEEEIIALNNRYGFTTFQLHGEESPEFCKALKDMGFNVIKAISIKDQESLDCIAGYKGMVDLLVLDTATSSRGGSGKKFDWQLLSDPAIEIDFLLSGGIGPDDAAAIRSLSLPHLAGIDLNSRFEVSPALKDPELLQVFLNELDQSKNYDLPSEG